MAFAYEAASADWVSNTVTIEGHLRSTESAAPRRTVKAPGSTGLRSNSDPSTQFLEILVLGDLDMVDADLRERPGIRAARATGS